jgi:hypothetical protein
MNWTTLRSASASHLRRSDVTMCDPFPFALVGMTGNLAETTFEMQVLPSQQQAGSLQ